MTVLRNQSQIEDASHADLVETYNALTGKSIKKFETRAAGQRRVEMAMLAAKDADAKTGVPRGADGQVKTRAEVKAKAAAKGLPPPPALDEGEPVFAQGSLGDQLDKATKTTKPIAPRAKKEERGARKTPAHAVQATFAGKSALQANSVRTSVLDYIHAAPNSACTIETLDKHFKQSTRGFLQKLLEKEHIVGMTLEQFAAAKPVKQKA